MLVLKSVWLWIHSVLWPSMSYEAISNHNNQPPSIATTANYSAQWDILPILYHQTIAFKNDNFFMAKYPTVLIE